ncbi:MAG TPA: EAL domain-containing protein [Noviherbaspirillum sp.]|uniref:EAL domain-containing protein n=1 Tax=Noviherbaspirillum sp. TaxID=1926288 RepID=UPI002D2FAB06|nr:EAL domain-containing protein [Noviherbaspirillum sp.]HYD94618.1 EAL domain-containing protein [Noviherbaspirillum sp.]
MATILIVDDHVLNRQFLMVLLGYSGHRLLEATNGAEGLELACAKRPDLVIADILMPNMDGYEFVTRLRAIPAIAHTPVIFYTAAYHEREAGIMAMACGVKWVLPKPSDPDLILKTVHEALGVQGKPLAEHAPAPVPVEQPRLGALDDQLSQYLTELETSSHLVSQLVHGGEVMNADIEGLQHVVQRLSKALSSLQAVSLRLTALIELGIELAAEREPRHLLDISCRVVQDICIAKYAAIGIFADDHSGLEHFVTRGIDQDTLARMEAPAPGAGLLGEMLAARAPKRLRGLQGDPTRVGLPAMHPPVHSILAVPVASQENVFGWLYLCDKLGTEEFSEVDERAAVTVAAQLAVVYENLLLYGAIQKQHEQLKLEVNDRKQAQEALRRSLRARTVMAECNHIMVHASDETSLLKDMCRTVVEAGGYRAAWIGYLDDGGSVRAVAHAGAPVDFQRATANRFAAAHAAGPEASKEPGRAWLVIDVAAGPPARAGLGGPGSGDDEDAVVSLPLKDHGRVFGVLTICEPHPGLFDAEQIAMLEELADDISFGVVSLRTKSAREQAERALRATEEKLSSILDSIDNVVWSATHEQFIYLNSMVEKIYGRPIEQFYRDRTLWFRVIHAEDRPAVLEAHAGLSRQSRITCEYRITRPDGEVRWIEERARAIRDERGQLQRFDGIAIDISERKAYEARIEYLAGHDALTSLANRNLLGDRITQAMAHSRRSGTLLALLFLDLDRFKGINDSFGHELGDALLLEVSHRLRAVIREGDTVARQGGDEFIILLTNLQRPQDVTGVVHKIFDIFTEPFIIRGHELFVSTSVGATIYPDDGEDMQSLLRNADIAMYRAKEERGNAFQFYSREMSVRALERAELESALRRALDRKEFELFYQPKVEAMSGKIIGAEALIRWNHPDMGMVSPTRFIPMAEEIGLIVPIGDWVLHTACAQNKAWQNAGLPPISISVNLSARQFRQEGLVESVARALEDMDLDARHLELELTESIVMNSAELFIEKLKELEDLGVQLSIDDFGTGYSSLSYLKRFPLHHLKIDQSFVRDIATDADDAAITSTVISLGHSLNLKVIAEGVETEEQVAFLRDHNCDEMQGYYFSRPLPANEFASLLRQAA